MEKIEVQSSWLTHIGLGRIDNINYLVLFQDDEATISLHPRSERIFEHIIELEAQWKNISELDQKYVIADDEIKAIAETAMENILDGHSERKVEGETRRLLAKRNSVLTEIKGLIDKRVIVDDNADKDQICEELVSEVIFNLDDDKLSKKVLSLITGATKDPSEKQKGLVQAFLKYRKDNKKALKKIISYGASSIKGLLINQAFLGDQLGEEYRQLVGTVRQLSARIKTILDDVPVIKRHQKHSKFGIVGTYVNMIGLTGESGYPVKVVSLEDSQKTHFIADLINQISGNQVLGRLVFKSEEAGEAVYTTPSGGHYTVKLNELNKDKLNSKDVALRILSSNSAVLSDLVTPDLQ